MIKMKTILHPTDFSEPSKYALEYAVACATEFEAKLYLLHVNPRISPSQRTSTWLRSRRRPKS